MIVIDTSLPIPPYEQLKEQIIDAQRSGELGDGYRLPSVRHLALELGLSPGTVARAYKELETLGIVETRGRHGTYLLTAREHSPALEDLAERFAFAARAAGVSNADALALVRQALD